MKRSLFVLIFASLGFSACGDDLDESPDGRDESVFVDGKADNALFSACGEKTLLETLSTKEELGEYLKSEGVHTRAAKNIEKKRNGKDEVFGTSDDFVFENMIQVDKVPYVGRVAMNQLAELVSNAVCTVPSSHTEVIFSPQPYADSHLVKVAKLIDGAEDSIDIAMYSYRDGGIAKALDNAVKRGVSVRFIFESANKDQKKMAGSKSEKLENIGIDVRYINKIMHHKYILIDGPRDVLSASASSDKGILATGSANWSTSAGTRYDENTVFVFGNSELNLKFQKEFNHLWGNSRDFSSKSFAFFESDSIDSSVINDDPNVDAIFTSANFKTSTSSRYGHSFSSISGKNTVSDRIIELIEGAQTSIRIASGHLRSRPVSEALLAKIKANPSLDVKVYLDAQEYVSAYTHKKELDKRNACLLKAGTSTSKQQKCLDKGFHYAFDIKEAGIPVRFKTYSYRWHYSYAVQMHHKYLVIDNDTVMAGSYNLSDNAEHNTMENMVVYQRAGFPELVDGFVNNFDHIWNTGEGKLKGLLKEIGTARKVPIVFESMALDWDQVRNLKRTISTNCPKVNSQDYRSKPERHFVCERN